MNIGSQSNNTNEKPWYKKKENWWIITGFIIATFAITVPFLIMFLTKLGFKLSNFESLGVVGDFFGGSTVGLLSLSSIIFVTAAIIMQKEELALQRKEVKKTREEYEITNQTMQKQQFDNTFFNMISLHNDILNAIEVTKKHPRYHIDEGYTEDRETFKSRAVIEQLYNELKLEFNESFFSYNELNEVYETFYEKHQNIIGHYYRNLYRIVKFVLSKKLEKEDEKFYMGLIRAQLSSFELIMLFYNISYSEAGQEFKKLLIGKKFFQKHIPSKLFINSMDDSILKEVEGD